MSKLLIPVAVIAALGDPSRADSTDAEDKAAQHIARATRLHEEGAFAKALAELQTAYALHPRPPLLFAMGQLHVQLGECTQAITYYERFLATGPARSQASLATQAIETCKTDPPVIDRSRRPHDEDAAAGGASVELPPPPLESASIAAPPPLELAPAVQVARRPWYGNYVSDGLVAAGVVAGIAGLVVYRGASGKRDAAEAFSDYQAYAAQIDRARSQRDVALVLGATGVALIAAGGAYFFLSERGGREQTVLVAPGADGGVVSWSGRW